ncbi:hypothetical protein K1T71_014599 [Dendrolimus kikuchii]|uniref:Uncharacterized protein n=1 Tax=Dendrolimus kikuchii TaxID=765133 RepID=A0ACC1CEP8_9NEOP|nr:hypothetical protein K1T71_014599 [Dendrolimus kikuchii]
METSILNGMCRCCALEGTFKDLKCTYHWMGEQEIYGDMLKECFNIDLSNEDGTDSGICEVCITQLRNAVNFKKQVLFTEEQFKKKRLMTLHFTLYGAPGRRDAHFGNPLITRVLNCNDATPTDDAPCILNRYALYKSHATELIYRHIIKIKLLN